MWRVTRSIGRKLYINLIGIFVHGMATNRIVQKTGSTGLIQVQLAHEINENTKLIQALFSPLFKLRS